MKKISKTLYKQVQPWERFLILCDLDGTLLDNKSKISTYTRDVIKRIVAEGHIFVLISGHTPHATLHHYKQLGLKHLMCNLNGAYIWNPSDKKFPSVNLCFNWNIAVDILSSHKIMQYVKNFAVENYKGTYMKYIPKAESELKELTRAFRIRNNQKISLCKSDLSNLFKVDCHSILLQLKSQSKEMLNKLIYELHSFSKKLNSHVWFDPEVGYLVEISTRFVTKPTALTYLSNYYSIPLEQCVVFGDGDNDIVMLKNAIYSFAMANASIPVKLAARYITKFANDNDGVARTLDYLDKSLARSLHAVKRKIKSEHAEIERLTKR